MITTNAIILRHRDVKECDRLYTMMTRDIGKVEVLATGVRKLKSKLAGHLLPHFALDVTLIRGRQFWRIAHARHTASYANILHTMETYALAAWACEAFDALIKRESRDPDLFSILQNFYTGLHEGKEQNQLLQTFLDHSFTCLGYRPEKTSVSLSTLLSFFEGHAGYPLKSLSVHTLSSRATKESVAIS